MSAAVVSSGPSPPESHHAKVQGGAARAAIFGISDGLVSNVSLVLGVAGATASQGVVRLAGLAGLLAGAFSMAAGEWVSMRGQAELLEAELEKERYELAHRPQNEVAELADIYMRRGVDRELATRFATAMMRDPELALEVHAREELGIDPFDLGSPARAALASFLSFSVGALIPLVPWFFADGGVGVALSIIAGSVGALLVGAGLARFTRRPAWASALRQLAIAVAAAAVTYAVGAAIGAGTSVT